MILLWLKVLYVSRIRKTPALTKMCVYIYHVRATQKRTSLEYVFFFLSRLMLDVFVVFFPLCLRQVMGILFPTHTWTTSKPSRWISCKWFCAPSRKIHLLVLLCVVRTLNISGHSYKYMYFTMKDLYWTYVRMAPKLSGNCTALNILLANFEPSVKTTLIFRLSVNERKLLTFTRDERKKTEPF